ncbi:MAG: response regulator [Syntrophobacteria bacterium]
MANILIVDNYRTIGLLYREVFEEEGHRVFVALSGKEAIDLALHERIDVAVVDANLTDTDADELLEELKRLQPRSQGTVCAVSEFDPAIHSDLCDESFFKSSDFTILQGKIRRLVQGTGGDRSAREKGTG